jgi:uncharacterized protein (TIGR04255 family)
VKVTLADRRVYLHPPIEEALCEFRFAPAEEGWDLTLPGRLQERLRDLGYTGKPRQQGVVEAGLGLPPGGSEAAFTLKQSMVKIQFPTADDRAIVAVGPDVLSVHTLKPYEGWESFKPRIAAALTAYTETQGSAGGVMRIGLRYINKVEFTAPSLDLAEYFTISPQVPSGLPISITGFISRSESVFTDSPTRLVLTFASVEAERDTSAFVLDLDLVLALAANEQIEPAAVLDTVEMLRAYERQAFESLITDAAREMFNAE